MNSQDLSNLQEAYFDVYHLDEGLIKYPWGYVTKQIERKKKSGDKSYKELQRRHERLRDLTSNELGKPEYRLQDSEKTQKEEYDLYDIILSHLLDEGYAETQEQAEAIMVNMSEDWRESIMEGIIDKKFPNRKYKIGIPDRNIEPDVIDDPETGYPVKKNNLRKMTRDEQKRKIDY